MQSSNGTKMRLITITLAAVSALASGTSHAHCNFHPFNASIMSDYVWRGLTLTDHGAAIRVGTGYHSDNAHFGATLTNVEEQPGSEGLPAELRLQFGYTLRANLFTIEPSVRSYSHLNDSEDDLIEVRLGVSSMHGIEIAINREFKDRFWYPEVNYRLELLHRLGLNLHAGYWAVDDAEDGAFNYRAEFSQSFPEFQNINVFVAATFITDTTPAGDDLDEDESESIFIVGIGKNF